MNFRMNSVLRLFQVGLNVVHGSQSSIFFGGRRKSGKSTVLREVYNRLFREQEKVIPFLYSVRRPVGTIETFERDYFQHVFLQFLAFIRHDSRLAMTPGMDITQMLQFAFESRFVWLVDSVRQYQNLLRKGDVTGLAELVVSLPEYVALNSGLHAFVMIDDFHRLDMMSSSAELAVLKSQFLTAFESQRAPHLLSGTLKPTFRNLYAKGEVAGILEPILLPPLKRAEAVELLEAFCRAHEVPWESELSSVIAEQLDCNPYYLQLLVRAARHNIGGLRSPRNFSELYLGELIHGSLHQYFSGLLQEVFGEHGDSVRALELLELTSHLSNPCPAEQFRVGHEEISLDQLSQTFAKLDEVGLLDFQNGIVSRICDPVLDDWTGWNCDYRIRGRSLAQLEFNLISKSLRRLQRSAEFQKNCDVLNEIKDLLMHAEHRLIPGSFLDYLKFHEFKGEQTKEETPSQRVAGPMIQLPQFLSVELHPIVVPNGDMLCNKLILARGYDRRSLDPSGEVSWLVAYYPDSESMGLDEITRFHEHLQLLSSAESLSRTFFWIITREKFNQSALSYATESKIYTSNLSQLNELKRYIFGNGKGIQKGAAESLKDSYEMTIPMSADSELVAVRALEQITEGLEMDEKAKSQLRMGLLEACIYFKECFSAVSERINFVFSPLPDQVEVHLKVFLPLTGLRTLPDPFENKILKTLLDNVQYFETGQGVELVLSKFLSTSKKDPI